MLVAEVMSRSVVTIDPEATVKEAAQVMSGNAITALPVIDHAGHLLGIVSEADLVRVALMPDQRAHERTLALSAGPASGQVGDVMTHLVLTISPHDDLASAAALMTGTEVKSLPVVEHQRVVGMLSRRDIVAMLARDDDAIHSELEARLLEAGTGWQAEVSEGVVVLDGPRTDREQSLAQALVSSVGGVVGLRFREATTD
jgi:CBS domain-containing protein